MNGSANSSDTCIASLSDAKVKYATFAPNFQGLGLPRDYYRPAISLISQIARDEGYELICRSDDNEECYINSACSASPKLWDL